MAAISLLPPPPSVDHVTSVVQWLELLELSHLEAKFKPYTLQRLSSFWEVELAAVSVWGRGCFKEFRVLIHVYMYTYI